MDRLPLSCSNWPIQRDYCWTAPKSSWSKSGKFHYKTVFEILTLPNTVALIDDREVLKALGVASVVVGNKKRMRPSWSRVSTEPKSWPQAVGSMSVARLAKSSCRKVPNDAWSTWSMMFVPGSLHFWSTAGMTHWLWRIALLSNLDPVYWLQ